jgi:hypothetical protein
MPCTPVSVSFEVIANDRLMKISFGLNKVCNNDGSSAWDIDFELDERTTPTGDFELVVKLKVDVNDKYSSNAQATANNGLDTSQTAYALGPAATAAQDYKNGVGTLGQAQTYANNVIAVRDPSSPS